MMGVYLPTMDEWDSVFAEGVALCEETPHSLASNVSHL